MQTHTRTQKINKHTQNLNTAVPHRTINLREARFITLINGNISDISECIEIHIRTHKIHEKRQTQFKHHKITMR